MKFSSILTITFKIVVFPIVLLWKGIKSLANIKKRKRTNKNDYPGIYIVSNSDKTIKIGRSKHVLKRLKQYRGY